MKFLFVLAQLGTAVVHE